MNNTDKSLQAEGSENEPRKRFVPPPKLPKTAEDLAAIAVLDSLRAGAGEVRPEGLPLACIVKVTAVENVPKAREAYAMATVVGAEGRTWRLCVLRGSVRARRNYLFVSDDSALPVQDRWRNERVCKVKEKVYNFGFGVKVRRLLPRVKRNIYIHNCGVLYPTADFPELKRARVGTVCAALLCVDKASILQARLQAPRPKKAEFLRLTRRA